MDSMRSSRANSSGILLRYLGYTIFFFAITGSLPALVNGGDVTYFSENGPIEWVQAGILAATATAFFIRSACRHLRDICLILGFISLTALTREMDAILDKALPLGWQLPAAIWLVSAGVIWSRGKERLANQIDLMAGSRVFAILWAGFIIAVPMTQLVGHGRFLQSLMGDDYNRDYKRVIEELGEVIGYIILLIGSIETYFLSAKAQADSASKPAQETLDTETNAA